MNIAVDIGNTAMRFAAFSGKSLTLRLSLPTRTLRAAELAAGIRKAFPRLGKSILWVSSVVPAVNEIVAEATRELAATCRFLDPARDRIIKHRLADFATPGCDRLLAARAAWDKYFRYMGTGGIVLQCGSAATVDLIDAAGYFRGGFILPGPGLWLKGLAMAAQLPEFGADDVDWNQTSYGDSSRPAMLGGVAVGLPAAALAAVTRLREEMEKEIRLSEPYSGVEEGENEVKIPAVISGGWHKVMTGIVPQPSFFEPNLVLHGIAAYAQRIRTSTTRRQTRRMLKNRG